METHYYWPDLVQDLGEIRRVLKPGGKLIIVAEAYDRGGASALQKPAMALLKAKFLTRDEHCRLFTAAEFAERGRRSRRKERDGCALWEPKRRADAEGGCAASERARARLTRGARLGDTPGSAPDRAPPTRGKGSIPTCRGLKRGAVHLLSA